MMFICYTLGFHHLQNVSERPIEFEVWRGAYMFKTWKDEERKEWPEVAKERKYVWKPLGVKPALTPRSRLPLKTGSFFTSSVDE
jgi:hypothetical protein